MGQHTKRQIALRLSDAAHDRLERLAEKRGSTKTQVIEDALAALDAGEQLTQADVIAAIKRNWKGK